MLNRFFAFRPPLASPAHACRIPTPAAKFEAVRLDRGGRAILSGLDLVVPQGSITAVLGPSGSGKSTLLAALDR